MTHEDLVYDCYMQSIMPPVFCLISTKTFKELIAEGEEWHFREAVIGEVWFNGGFKE